MFRTETWLTMTHFPGHVFWDANDGTVAYAWRVQAVGVLISSHSDLHFILQAAGDTKHGKLIRLVKTALLKGFCGDSERGVLSKKLFHSENTLITLLLSGFWFPHEDLMQEHQWGDLHYPAQRGLNLHLISVPGPSVNHGKRCSGSPALLTVVPLSRGWMQGSQFVVPKQCAGVGWMKSPGEL